MAEETLGYEDYARKHNVDPSNIPKHVAIIMDGNGRWAKKRLMPRVFGHRKGAERVKEVVESAGELGVDTLTLFAFSDENWRRPAAEVNTIMGLLKIYLEKEKENLNEKNVRLETIGDISRLPESNQKVLTEVIDYLSGNDGLRLVLALSYGGRTEITGACRKIAEQVKLGTLELDDIDSDLIGRHLFTDGFPELDLLVRSSGENRISNFLLWQAAYSEFYFTSVLWPDFRSDDFLEAVRSYQSRERRFGAVAEDRSFEKSSALQGGESSCLNNGL